MESWAAAEAAVIVCDELLTENGAFSSGAKHKIAQPNLVLEI